VGGRGQGAGRMLAITGMGRDPGESSWEQLGKIWHRGGARVGRKASLVWGLEPVSEE